MKIARNDKSVTCSCLHNCFFLFYGRDWQEGVFKIMKIDNFFGIFSRLGPFPEVFGQVKEWLIFELHEMIKVPYAVSCPMDFNLLCGPVQKGGVLRLMKNDQFLVFLTVWVLFPKFSAG